MTESSFLRALFDGMRCGILCVDGGRRLVVLNDQAQQILALPRCPEPGIPLATALAEHPRLIRLLEDAFLMTSLPNREELVLGDDEHPGRTIGYTLSHFALPDETVPGMAMFFRDLTPIERKEEQARLKDRLAALGEMAASLAHEIRNPLASIEVTCSLLRRRLEDDATRAMLDKITAEVRRLNATIASSLEFVRPVSLHLSAGNVVAMLEEAIEVAAGRIHVEAVRIHTDWADGIPDIEMDRDQMRQVFENLVLNAVEAVRQGGTIDIRAERVDSGVTAAGVPIPVPVVQIRVADSGPGIEDENIPKIFYPFFTTKDQGSGVGLSMAKKIVDCHHGQIEVENGDPGGAVFTVRLPIHQA